MRYKKIIASVFPIGSYPVLYKYYWKEDLDESKRIKNNTIGEQLQAIQQVYQTYYNKILNVTTLQSYTFSDDREPGNILFVINYLDKGKVKYLWEYFDNWVGILELN